MTNLFQKALPVFPQKCWEEMNTYVLFRDTAEDLNGAEITIAAAYFYRLTVNGQFVAFGPARTAKGYARVDRHDLSKYNKVGGNTIEIEVVAYNCNSLSYIQQPGFLQCEVTKNGQVLLATGKDFKAFLPKRKVQKVQRYSLQRQFAEVWDYRKDAETPVACAVLENAPKLLERKAPYPDYEVVTGNTYDVRGNFVYDETLPYHTRFYSHMGDADDMFRGMYDEEDIEYMPYVFIQRQRQNKTAGAGVLPLTLNKGEYILIDLHRVECGFLHFLLVGVEDYDLAVGFSEDCDEGTFAFTDMHAHNALEILGKAGTKDFYSLEPYVAKYLILMVKEGSVTVKEYGVRSHQHTMKGANIIDCGSDVLNAVYRGATRTLCHNAVDIFTDCPSRERAGWLCDSYFTGKAEYALFGNSKVEEDFLENFVLFENEGNIPEGALPMAYPADFNEVGKFIPQWTMWYVLEVCDYLKNRKPTRNKEFYKKSIDGLLGFYARYENEDGLLEDLPSWNFVEWSRANEWTKNVNYPTNFLYAGVLTACAETYGRPELKEKADKIRKKAVEQSFIKGYFHDHALRENGKLVLQEDASEAGQYYAILFGNLNLKDEKYDWLMDQILHNFGATRKTEVAEITPVNAFIGAYLRLEALLKLGEKDLLKKDIGEFFGCMEQVTGTLWEYRQRHGSRDHGFASYVLFCLQEILK